MIYTINIEWGAYNVKYKDRLYKSTYKVQRQSKVEYVLIKVDKQLFTKKKHKKLHKGKSKSFKNTKRKVKQFLYNQLKTRAFYKLYY